MATKEVQLLITFVALLPLAHGSSLLAVLPPIYPLWKSRGVSLPRVKFPRAIPIITPNLTPALPVPITYRYYFPRTGAAATPRD